MKRIDRTTLGDTSNPAFFYYEQLLQVLNQYLPHSTASIFARPQPQEDGSVIWVTALDGHPQPAQQLSEKERTELETALKKHLLSIHELSERLEQQPNIDPQWVSMLRLASERPTVDHLYSLNGMPVMTFWGGGGYYPKEVVLPTVPEVADLASPIPVVEGVSATEVETAPTPVSPIPIAPVNKNKRWWWYLLAFLLLLALWWWLYREEPSKPVPQEPVPQASPVAPISALDRLKQKLEAAKGDCVALRALQAEEPLFHQTTMDEEVKPLYQQVEQGLLQCYLQDWRQTFDAAGQDCIKLEQLQSSTEPIKLEQVPVDWQQELKQRLFQCGIDGLSAKIVSEETSCETLIALQQDVRLQSEDEPILSLKTQMNQRIHQCQLADLAQQFNTAQDNCPQLAQIAKDPLLAMDTEDARELKKKIQQKLQQCQLQAFKQRLEQSKTDCLQLQELQKESLLKANTPEVKAVRAQLEQLLHSKSCQIQQLQKKIATLGQNCDQLLQLYHLEPLFKDKDPQLVAIKKDLGSHIMQHCRKKMLKEAKNMCPEDRPKELSPQMAIVFDASGSMRYTTLMSNEALARELRQMNVVGELFGALSGSGGTAQRLLREPTRISGAKQASRKIISQAASDVSIGMVLVKDCPRAHSMGFFAPNQRAKLQSIVSSLQPDAGTPLADGIAQAANMLDGVNREGVIVVISDGGETCDGDPCAVARQIAQQKPLLKINVVDLVGEPDHQCLAQATGGHVYDARNVDKLLNSVQKAAQIALPAKGCVKP